jgi:transposase
MEKEFLEGCLAEGMSLEAIGKRVGKHESTVSHWLKKYGLEAARAEKHKAKGAPAKEELEQLLATRSIASRNCGPDGLQLGDHPPLDAEVRAGDGAIVEASRIKEGLSKRIKNSSIDMSQARPDVLRR